jgi:hypothetical protein
MIGKIQERQKEELLEYCNRHGKKLKSVWYFPNQNEIEFMSDLFHTKEPWMWYRVDNVFQADGFLFHDKRQIKDFLEDTLNRPSIQEIFLDDKRLKYNPKNFSIFYQDNMQLPQLNEDQVLVHYGFVDRLAVTYVFMTDFSFFDEKNLELHFKDCGEHGIVLSSLLYEGKAPKKATRGSTGVHVLEVKFLSTGQQMHDTKA